MHFAVLRQNSKAIIRMSVARKKRGDSDLTFEHENRGPDRCSAGAYSMNDLHVPAQFIPKYIRRKEAALQRPIRRERSRLGVDTRVNYPVDGGRCLRESSEARHVWFPLATYRGFDWRNISIVCFYPSSVATHKRRQLATACGLAAHQYTDDVYL